MKRLKRILALFLSLFMMLSINSMPVFAASMTKTANTTASIYLTPGTSGTTNIIN